MEKLFDEFESLWRYLANSGIDIDITFEDGTIHRITDSVELCLNNKEENYSLSVNPT